MGLFKRRDQLNRHRHKSIRITHAAEVIGCSAESIRTGAVGNFRLFKLNPEKATSPWLMYEADLNHYLEKRDKEPRL